MTDTYNAEQYAAALKALSSATAIHNYETDQQQTVKVVMTFDDLRLIKQTLEFCREDERKAKIHKAMIEAATNGGTNE